MAEEAKVPLLEELLASSTVVLKEKPDHEHENEDHGILVRKVWIESKKLWHIVGPAIFSRIVSYSMFVITQAFAGHLSDHEFAAISIAFNVIAAFSFGLMSQLKTLVIAWVSLASLAVHLFVSWLFVYKLQLGVVGTAITMNFSWWVLVIGHLGYTVFGGCPLTWAGFSTKAFSGLWEFVKLSASSGVMLCLENWYYTILILMAGSLNNAEIAVDALSICMTINTWEMMLPLSFFAGTGVRVANELGAGNGRAAKFATVVSVTTSIIIGIFFWSLIIMFHREIALIFTSSKPVLQEVSRLSVLLALTILLNSVQPILSGVAVGSGWQSYVAYINLGCYYLIGMPLGYFLGWVFKLGLMGIWAGMIGGTAIQTLILIIITIRCDWEKEGYQGFSVLVLDTDSLQLCVGFFGIAIFFEHLMVGFGDWASGLHSVWWEPILSNSLLLLGSFFGTIPSLQSKNRSVESIWLQHLLEEPPTELRLKIETPPPPLLPKQIKNDKKRANRGSKVLIESKKLWHIVGPSIFSRVSTYSMFVISQAFAGHLGDLELAAFSISANVIIGFNFGLLSQIKTGAIAWVSLAALVIHVILNWFFMYRIQTGLFGIIIILNISWWISVIGLLVYTLFGGCPLTWSGFSIEAFSGLWEFVKLSVASGVMLCLENWYYRILIVMTGNLDNAEIAVDALSICMSINGWEMMIPLGFFAATG
ncbi:hypothetical protein FEM48_Zijuj08G0148700 [Ziziphus jujuba var. spinosa]|uniref:Protein DETOXIFICATION n=1 Tax=Ziziphus jujuba var. spinosa TaxID=714518 RepID=A0A978UZR8_ZIZJJ|nr:hypothetical protein FEM48_Zijuj08G0148700 [Ziziphus jujuba var. spinosa]